MTEPASILDLNDRIRSLVNEPRKHALVRRSAESFNMMCTCMDVIADTQLAIESYPQFSASDQARGSSYVLLYGILQVLFVQQDAVDNIMLALGLEGPEMRSLLKEVRGIRNDATGHPTRRHESKKYPKGKAYNFMVAPSVSPRGFDLMTVYRDDRPHRYREIAIADLISEQEEVIAEALGRIIEQLEEERRLHMEEHGSKKLEDVFPQTLSYFFQKLYEGCIRADQRQLGLLHLDLITEVVDEFKAALEERDILDAYDFVTQALDELEWPMSRLREFLTGDSDLLEERSALIFREYCKARVDHLLEAARVIDEEYDQGEPVEP